MKTTLKQWETAIFIALIVMVVNVKAEGTEKGFSHCKNTEKTLQLEKWMTDEATWDVHAAKITAFIQETETGLELDNWMVNPETWNLNSGIVHEVETGIKLESWMIDETTWNKKNIESELKLQAKIFTKKMKKQSENFCALI
ncbi:MAG: hypothetical protein R2757_17965 [Draconibacterium sp.]|jgi:hypothetical protein